MGGTESEPQQDYPTPSPNVEVGAGFGDFGKRFYPHCYLTECNRTLVGRAPALDVICDAHKLPLVGSRFGKVIMCNPYPYGFGDMLAGRDLLRGFVRILSSEGEILIIGHSSNKYCQPRRIDRAVAAVNEVSGMSMSVEVEPIVAAATYPDYVFYTCDRRPTQPNLRIRIRI